LAGGCSPSACLYLALLAAPECCCPSERTHGVGRSPCCACCMAGCPAGCCPACCCPACCHLAHAVLTPSYCPPPPAGFVQLDDLPRHERRLAAQVLLLGALWLGRQASSGWLGGSKLDGMAWLWLQLQAACTSLPTHCCIKLAHPWFFCRRCYRRAMPFANHSTHVPRLFCHLSLLLLPLQARLPPGDAPRLSERVGGSRHPVPQRLGRFVRPGGSRYAL